MPWLSVYVGALHAGILQPAALCTEVNLQRLSVLGVRPCVQRSFCGVGNGVLQPVSLISGIVVAWDANKDALTGDTSAPVLTWLLREVKALI
jgi:hypothetical protein